MAYDTAIFWDPTLDPRRDIHQGMLPRPEQTKGLAIVYVAMCLRSPGDCYVGITEKGLPARKAQHLWAARAGSSLKFHRAIRKHGAENFYWAAFEVWPTYFDALEAERRLIRILKPTYNLTDGGGGVKGLRHTEDAKKKMSEAKRGKPSIWTKTPMPQEIRDRLAAARRAERGRPRSARATAASAANALKANAARRRPVICINSGVQYESAVAASLALGVKRAQVTNSCVKGSTLRPSGLKFKYAVT